MFDVELTAMCHARHAITRAGALVGLHYQSFEAGKSRGRNIALTALATMMPSAISLWLPIAKPGHADTQYNLGLVYADGWLSYQVLARVEL